MEIKVFVFDLDGTLMDSEIIWVYAVHDYLNDKGIPMNYEEAEQLVYGNSWEYIYEELEKNYPVLKNEMPYFIDNVYPYFDKYAERMQLEIPGSIQLLKNLSQNYTCAIVSGSYRRDVEEAIRRLDISEYVSLYLGKEDYFPGKPHPAGYLKAVELLNVKPDNCVAFEDSTVGVTAAKTAGMYCVALARHDRPKQDISLADLILPDLSQFSLELLKQTCQKKCSAIE
ncbi:MAG TPA: HAD family phosphatase [Candidatus Hydrogenedens sp.]|nr:HAD family phosphatase [Candidatus Hydrogenedens sp.]HOK09688.1 HAD family phosphatase [Candidatus Hydrogenedens sp.]HOL19277.1 HAD family phosphatase [Candidatus Hydrogenedens sp.]HPP59230.1 HAD family phosphatase [Candidatus Hydrogenedens sp.]